MERYLYLSPDLRKTGVLETSLLSDTTERHKIHLAVPRMRPATESIDVQAARADISGVVLGLSAGFPGVDQLRAMGKILHGGKPVWLHWRSEGAVERVDDERLVSFRRLWAAIVTIGRLHPILWRLGSVRRVPRALKWAYRGSFPIDRPGLLDRLHGLYEVARPVPFPSTAWSEKGMVGAGLYVRTDFWNAITSGGSYGHTCYVAKELKRSSGDFVALLPHRYPLLDALDVRQVAMDMPVRQDGEAGIADATQHYYGILKAACQLFRPAYIYERLCLGNYAAAMVCRELQIPYVVEYNGSELSIQRSFDGAAPFSYAEIHLAAEALAFRQATAISVVSQIVKDDLVARGVDASKILVNPNGADVDAYAPAGSAEKAGIRQELGFAPADRVVGFIASFGGWHGVHVLSAAIPRILSASDRIRFLIIGDGTYKPDLDEAIASHDLEDRVRSVGRVPQAEGARLLKACDIYVAPHDAHMVDSRFFGSPTKIFEYMAMAGGVVASDLEQIGHVLSPALVAADVQRADVTVGAERAVLCTPGSVDEFVDAVIGLASRPDLCLALGRNSRQAVIDQFSWKVHVDKLWCLARQRTGETFRSVVTGEADKDQVQEQWNNTPVGSERAKRSQPHTLDWFREIEANRYKDYAPWMPEVMEFAAAAGQDVLEIGGGLGIDLAQFAEHGARVTDVDLSAGHLQLADEHFRLRGLAGRFVHHDGEDLPFGDNAFDLVYSNGVIHHTPNTHAVVDEIYRVLKPGGRVIAMVYAENSLHYWRNLVFARGFKEGQLQQWSMGDIMSRSVENTGTDARPLVKVYTRKRLRRLFRRFAHPTILQRQLRADELPAPLRPFRPAIERMAGWNLIIKATKAS